MILYYIPHRTIGAKHIGWRNNKEQKPHWIVHAIWSLLYDFIMRHHSTIRNQLIYTLAGIIYIYPLKKSLWPSTLRLLQWPTKHVLMFQISLMGFLSPALLSWWDKTNLVFLCVAFKLMHKFCIMRNWTSLATSNRAVYRFGKFGQMANWWFI